MKRLLLIICAAFVLLGCEDQNSETSSAETQAIPSFFADGNEVVVTEQDPRHRQLGTYTLVYDDSPILPPASATLAYDETHTVRMTSPISGRVISMPLALGSQLKKGDVVLQLDSPDFNDALSALEKATANQKLAKESFIRAQKLFEAKVMSRKDFEQAQDGLVQANSEFERSRKYLEKLGVQAGGLSMQTGAFHLRSPIEGTVTEVKVNPGMEVRPDLLEPLYIISDLSKLWLWVDVFEKDIAKVAVGQPITVRVASWPDYAFYGKVDYLSQVVHPQTRSIQVRCQLTNTELKLLPAMHAQVSIRNRNERPNLLIPLTAVITEGDKHYVFSKIGADRYRWQEVTLGMRFEKQAMITGGLEKGDQVLSNGALALRRDMLLLNSMQ
ncbi:MAG: efflux RND transporter periplasmic adaptor subunit [Gammaproteobacteria bacterium]|nr:efflux RND transporter periplasmic adaptor subunit [Gammaproteobacteria bacterium]